MQIDIHVGLSRSTSSMELSPKVRIRAHPLKKPILNRMQSVGRYVEEAIPRDSIIKVILQMLQRIPWCFSYVAQQLLLQYAGSLTNQLL